MWTVPAAAIPRHKDHCIHGGTQHIREPARARREPRLPRGCWLGFPSDTVSIPKTNFCGELPLACVNRNKSKQWGGFRSELSAYGLVNPCMT